MGKENDYIFGGSWEYLVVELVEAQNFSTFFLKWSVEISF